MGIASTRGGSVVEERQLGSSYRLQEHLGEGASGSVFAAVDRGGRRFAVKLLRDDLARDQGIVSRFVQERTLLASIRHPNVVEVHDLVVEGSTLAIVMDLVDGGDLRSELRTRGTIPPAQIAVWGSQIALALDAAHQKGIVHRDVKPENILIDSTGTARLTDFGIAKLVDGSARSTMLLGTPQYMAPEIAEDKEAGSSADLYSLGVTLYELACGVPPFAGRGAAMATLRAHALELPGRPSGIPNGLWSLIDALLAKDPRNRPPSGQAVAQSLADGASAWASLPAGQVLTAPPAPRGTIQPVQPSAPFDDNATIMAVRQAPAGMAASDNTVFVNRPGVPPGGSSPWGSPAGGGYPQGGYASSPGQGYYYPHPGVEPQPADTSRKRTLIAVGSVLGAALLFGGGIVVANPGLLKRGSASAPATQAPTTPVPAATTAPAEPTTAPTTVVTVTQTQEPPADNGQARLDEAHALVMGYNDTFRGGALTQETIGDYWAPTLTWYDKSMTRAELYNSLPDPGANARAFDPPEYRSFRPGAQADEVDYLVRYHNSSGTGAVIVTYTIAPTSEGRRIVAVRERST